MSPFSSRPAGVVNLEAPPLLLLAFGFVVNSSFFVSFPDAMLALDVASGLYFSSPSCAFAPNAIDPSNSPPPVKTR